MLKETDMRAAILTALDGGAAYAMRFDGDDIFTMAIGKCRLDYLKNQEYTFRFLVDEPEEHIEIEPVSEITIATEDITDNYPGEPKDLPFTPEKSELEGLAVHDPTVKKSKPGPKPKIDTGKLMALHNAGWDDAKIADELKVNIKTVRKYLREAREDGEGDRDSKDILDRIKALLDTGLNDVQIANELDMPRETILKYLREEGTYDD